MAITPERRTFSPGGSRFAPMRSLKMDSSSNVGKYPGICQIHANMQMAWRCVVSQDRSRQRLMDARPEIPSQRSGSQGYPSRRDSIRFPTVTRLHDVVSCDVAPRDERNENDDHKTGPDILSSCGGDLVSGPQGQSERNKVDCLPDKLEEQQWDHLHGIAQAEHSSQAETRE